MDEQKQTEEKLYTQADIDKAIGRKIAEFRGKYADYDDLKAKVAEFEAVKPIKSDDDPVADITAKHEAEMQSMREEIEALKGLEQEPKPSPRAIGEPTNWSSTPDKSKEQLLKDAELKAKRSGRQSDIVAYALLKKKLKRR